MAKPKKDCCKTCKGRATYEKEILLKIEEFRLARSHWLASKIEKNETVVNTEADLNESNFQKLRHFKTVRPLPYFTLRKKLSDSKLQRMLEKEREKELALAQGMVDEDELEDLFNYELELEEKKGNILNEKEKEEVANALGISQKKKKEKKRKGPSKKVIDNLRASKQCAGLVDSFKCNDGKEVTVVIKGFCLCDKDNVRKFKLDKIRENYRDLGKPKPNPLEDKIKPHYADSLEVYKKRQVRKHEEKGDSEEPEMVLDESERGKHIFFRKDDETRDTKDKIINGHEEEDQEKSETKKHNEKEDEETKQDTEKGEEELENKEKDSKKESKKKESDPKKKPEDNIISESLVMLYKNRTPEMSDYCLTEEQSKKMSKVE